MRKDTALRCPVGLPIADLPCILKNQVFQIIRAFRLLLHTCLLLCVFSKKVTHGVYEIPGKKLHEMMLQK